ncbi:MAG: hypothetical protein A2096_01105 [Spirochaetes bacterium GWF1_41_5]|nr:MAG: hypothetical protein A2096_01105 [Spirochaetes bacterium GWF1_41_5]HBE03152.1 heat-shock protein Hsp70 [Spirochaetia bacterium]
MNEVIVGIDLGTTNSEIAVFVDNRIEIIKDDDGSAMLPSCVGMNSEGKLVVGAVARNQYALYPEKTVKSIKRKMGLDEKIRLGENEYAPQEISAMILRSLKNRAEKRLGCPVHKAVITVPAQFNDAQRQATRDAGRIAGLEVVRILNEPTAACLAYEGSGEKKQRKVLAFDFGGGTFDVSVVTMEDDVVEVIASRGDNHLGGDDIDNIIKEWIKNKIAAHTEKDREISRYTDYYLNLPAENAKHRLSDYPHARIIETSLKFKDGDSASIDEELDREEYNAMIRPLMDKMLSSVHGALDDAKLKADDIDEIILVGGSTRIPYISETLAREIGKTPRQDVHPDLAVALGAGIMAARLMGQENQKVLVDITPYTFGTSCLGFVNGEYAPFQFVPVLKAGTPLPASKAEAFFTIFDNQEKVEVKIFQGQDPDARKNIFLGDFQIENLGKYPSGNKIILDMNLDLDGILRVSAIEKKTGLQKDITIKDALSKLSDEQILKSKEEIEKLFHKDSMVLNMDEDEDTDEETVECGSEAVKITDIDQNISENTASGEENSMNTRLRELQGRVRKQFDSMDDIDRTDTENLLSELKNALACEDHDKFCAKETELNDILFFLEKK